MYGVILAAHGSRDFAAEEAVSKIGEELSSLLPEAHVALCIVKRSGNGFDRAFKELDSMGIKEIVVFPYFLCEGALVTDAIPCAVDEQRRKYPDKQITIKAHLGADKRLAQLVADKIKE